MADPVRVFQYIGETAESALNLFVLVKAFKLIYYIAPIVVVAVTIYILILGYQVMIGRGSFENFASIALRILLVVGVTGTYTAYHSYVVEGYRAVETALIVGISPGDNVNASVDVPAGIYEELDEAITKAFSISNKIQEEKEGGFRHIAQDLTLTLSQGVVLFSIGLMTVMGGLIIIAAKIAIAALLAVGPVFIFLFMFPATTQFAVSWLTQLWNYTFQMFFVIMFIALGLTIGEAYMDRYTIGENTDGDSLNIFLGAAQLLFVSFVIYGLLRQVNGLASAIAGGTSINPTSLSAVKNGVQSALKGAASPITAPARFLSQESTRKDSQGKMHTTSRLGHMRGRRSIATSLGYIKTTGNNGGKKEAPKEKGGSVSKNNRSNSSGSTSNKYRYSR